MDTNNIKAIKLSLDDDLKIHGIANSLQRSQDGFQLDSNSAKQNVGRELPLLFGHNWASIPVGKVAIQDLTDDGLEFNGELYKSVDDLDLIKENIENGTLSVSIGGIKPYGHKQQNDPWVLVELSLTPIPADANASVVMQDLARDDINTDSDTNKEVKDMKKKLQAETDTGTDTTDDTTTDTEPTLQDLMDAISSLADDVSAIKDAVVKDDSSDSSDDSAVQDLKKQMHEIIRQGLNGKTAHELYSLSKTTNK